MSGAAALNTLAATGSQIEAHTPNALKQKARTQRVPTAKRPRSHALPPYRTRTSFRRQDLWSTAHKKQTLHVFITSLIEACLNMPAVVERTPRGSA